MAGVTFPGFSIAEHFLARCFVTEGLKEILPQTSRHCPMSDSDARISLSKITKPFARGQKIYAFFLSKLKSWN